jgi:transcriptional regulator with XRE-family HTH domain
MRNRSHPLRVWLLKNDMPVAEFAAEVGCTANYVYRAINQEQPISAMLAKKIRLATRGRIIPQDFTISKGGQGKRPRPPLSLIEVRRIRKARDKGVRLHVLASQYNVSVSMISRIASGDRHAP